MRGREGERTRGWLVGYIFWRRANDNDCGNDFEGGGEHTGNWVRFNSPVSEPCTHPLPPDGDPPLSLIVKNIGSTGQLGAAFLRGRSGGPWSSSRTIGWTGARRVDGEIYGADGGPSRKIT